jgi:hypothetical protein
MGLFVIVRNNLNGYWDFYHGNNVGGCGFTQGRPNHRLGREMVGMNNQQRGLWDE